MSLPLKNYCSHCGLFLVHSWRKWCYERCLLKYSDLHQTFKVEQIFSHFPGAHWASEVDGASGPKVHLNFFECLSFILHMIFQYVFTKYLPTFLDQSPSGNCFVSCFLTDKTVLVGTSNSQNWGQFGVQYRLVDAP